MPKQTRKTSTADAALALANAAWATVYNRRAPWILPTSPVLARHYPDARKPVVAGAVRILRERTKTQRERSAARASARFVPTEHDLRTRVAQSVITTFDRAFVAAGFRSPGGDEHLETRHDNGIDVPTIDNRRQTRWVGRWSRLDVIRRIRVPSRWMRDVHREGLAHALGERTLVVAAKRVTSSLWAVTYWRQGRGIDTASASTHVHRDPVTGAWLEVRNVR